MIIKYENIILLCKQVIYVFNFKSALSFKHLYLFVDTCTELKYVAINKKTQINFISYQKQAVFKQSIMHSHIQIQVNACTCL